MHVSRVCDFTCGAHDLELHFANVRAMSLPGDDEKEYRVKKCRVSDHHVEFHLSDNAHHL